MWEGMQYLDSLRLKNICENNQLKKKKKAVPKPVMSIGSMTGTKCPLSSLQREDINK